MLPAALGVFGTGTGWPDILTATIMAALAVAGGWQIVRHGLAELADRPVLSFGTVRSGSAKGLLDYPARRLRRPQGGGTGDLAR